MAKRIDLRGLKVRHAIDRRMIRDCIRNYGDFELNEDTVVLDLGCNVGGFQYWLKDSPIKQYVGIDAFEDNIRFYRENNLPDRSNFEIFHGAATTSDDDTHSFWIREDAELGSSNGQSNPSKRQKVLRNQEVVVPNFNIDKLIEKYKPTILKMDIKGTEMLWLEKNEGIMPSCVKQWFGEIYTKRGSIDYDKLYWPIQKEQGFDVTFLFPTEKFIGMGDWYSLPNLGKVDVNAQLYDLNILISRSTI
tara:strand:- start:44 stop:784 length:741 start_codon:yes stop_codon:yes gene_type:complete